jgi:hypothetical protein
MRGSGQPRALVVARQPLEQVLYLRGHERPIPLLAPASI